MRIGNSLDRDGFFHGFGYAPYFNDNGSAFPASIAIIEDAEKGTVHLVDVKGLVFVEPYSGIEDSAVNM